MLVRYTLLRPDLDQYEEQLCDTYKFELHPVTGRYSLQMLEVHGSESKLLKAVAGVVSFHVERR